MLSFWYGRVRALCVIFSEVWECIGTKDGSGYKLKSAKYDKDSGKSTMIETISNLLGTYAVSVRAETLTIKNNRQPDGKRCHKRVIVEKGQTCYNPDMGNHRARRLYPSYFSEGSSSPPDERKEGDTMITYQDFFLFCTFIVALISLLYQIFKDKRK